MFSDLVLFDDAKELKAAGKKLGIGRFVIAREFKSAGDVKKISVEKNFLSCFLLRKADEKAVHRFFCRADFIAVWGGNPGINKFASSNKHVDFLLAPCTAEKSSIDTAIIRTAKENNVSIAVPLTVFESAGAFHESQLFKHYLLAAKLCRRFRVKFLVFSAARNVNELKTAEELVEFGKAFGFSEKQLRAWHNGL